MATTWVSTDAGRHLRGRVKAGTQPELLLRRALRAAGVGYRVQHRIARGCTPDIALLGAKVAVFVDGCFWHGCPHHGRAAISGPNATLWQAKFARNRERDQRADDLARAAGFEVVRLWECTVIASPEIPAAMIRHLRDNGMRPRA